jgi:hypothetical protein
MDHAAVAVGMPFDFKLRAICIAEKLDNILPRPLEWQQTVAEIQRRVDIVRSTRAPSASVATSLEDPRSTLDREQAKAKRLALIIIGRLSQTVTRMLQSPSQKEMAKRWDQNFLNEGGNLVLQIADLK